MIETASRPPGVEPPDRLALTFCVAVLVHAMLVLGVSFRPERHPPRPVDTLEIALVSTSSPERPERPDALAQANSVGGGDAGDKARPAAPFRSENPSPVAQPAAEPSRASTAARSAAANAPSPQPAPVQPRAKPQPTHTPERVTSRVPHPAPLPTPAATTQPPAPPTESPSTAENPADSGSEAPTPSASQLITRSLALASLNAEIEDRLESRARRARQKYISANTQEYRYAAYMEAWRAKVERIGNLNYPDEARQRQLSGDLLLDVAIRPDGSVLEIQVRRSSGHKVLDDAAVRIVTLAAPYAPFPPDIAREVDILHVTRVWRFLNTERFTAQ